MFLRFSFLIIVIIFLNGFFETFLAEYNSKQSLLRESVVIKKHRQLQLSVSIEGSIDTASIITSIVSYGVHLGFFAFDLS